MNGCNPAIVDGALDVEIRAFRAVVVDVEQEAVRQRALDIEIPDLHVAELVIRIDREIIGDKPGWRGRKAIGEARAASPRS